MRQASTFIFKSHITSHLSFERYVLLHHVGMTKCAGLTITISENSKCGRRTVLQR